MKAAIAIRRTGASLRRALLLTGIVCFVSGCGVSAPGPAEGPYVERHVVTLPPADAPLPEGVIAYCWEEPMVDFEKVRPGLDTDRVWYHPSHTAVREVRSGKWRPCRPVVSQAHGE